jgi:hypothetical protein
MKDLEFLYCWYWDVTTRKRARVANFYDIRDTSGGVAQLRKCIRYISNKCFVVQISDYDLIRSICWSYENMKTGTDGY